MFRLDDTSSRNRGFVNEGNVPIFLFSTEPTLVQFLVKRFPDDLYRKQGKSEEEIQELFDAEKHVEWINPKDHWEHTVRDGGRFSTAYCINESEGCKYCIENRTARDDGVTENRMLPYPMRKRYILPAWFYDQKKLMFVKQAGDFFDELQNYLEEHKKGKDFTPLDFKIFKQGRGLDTRYKVMYVGPSKAAKKPKDLMKPKDVDLTPIEQRDFREFAEEDEAPKADASQGKKVAAKDFVIDFGSYSGQTLQEIYDSGDTDFLEFLRDKSTGVVQEKATTFLKGKKK